MRLEGQQFGRYRFERLIGRGAMGEVYLAVDPRIHQQVAVKVLQAETSAYPATNVAREAERFRREASAIANLRHPHIVPLYDYDETSIDETAITYLVIPYYKEGSFTSWLRRRGSDLLPMEDVVYFVQQAADALQYAHNQQIIHRDVKPSNFLIETSEDPNRPNLLLADFGISKFAMGTTAGGTQSLGTLTYMPPEQLNGRPTYASDQYALAIMAYELLVGHPPFEGPPPVVIRQHMEDQPQPPSMLNPGLPRAVDHVLLRALEKKPENRYPTISEFARALQQALPGTSDIPNIQPESSSGELQRSSEVREPQKGSDIRATLRISPAEAQRGTDRMVTLPGGRLETIPVPANANNGQVLDFPGLGESSSSGGPAGNLIVTLTITSPDVPPPLRATEAATVLSGRPIKQYLFALLVGAFAGIFSVFLTSVIFSVNHSNFVLLPLPPLVMSLITGFLIGKRVVVHTAGLFAGLVVGVSWSVYILSVRVNNPIMYPDEWVSESVTVVACATTCGLLSWLVAWLTIGTTVAATVLPGRPRERHLFTSLVGALAGIFSVLLTSVIFGVLYNVNFQSDERVGFALLPPLVMSLITGFLIGKRVVVRTAGLFAGLVVGVSWFIYVLYIMLAHDAGTPYFQQEWVAIVACAATCGPLSWLVAWLTTRTHPYYLSSGSRN
jgi:serine/threonine protein kinase